MLDPLRLAVEKDFAGDYLECKQESAAVAAGHALRLVHRAPGWPMPRRWPVA
jgi:hypothetical protein